VSLLENCVPLGQARYLFKLKDKPQSDHRLIDITALSGRIHLSRDVAPGLAVTAFGRQVTLHELANVGERGQGHDGRDFQRSRKLPRPVRAGQLNASHSLNASRK
jgi:hypothetical protein